MLINGYHIETDRPSLDTITLSKDRLTELLTDSTKQGIELGKQMILAKKKIPIDSPAFNPSQLFLQGKYPHLVNDISPLYKEHGIRDDNDMAIDGRFHYAEGTIRDLIRKLVLAGFNATANKYIPVRSRRDALTYYDQLCEDWLAFAEKNLPYYSKGGNANADNS